MLLCRSVAAVAAKAEAQRTTINVSNALRLLGRSCQNNPNPVGTVIGPVQLQHLLLSKRFAGSTSYQSMSSSWITGKLNDEDRHHHSNNKDVIRNQRLYYHALPKIRVTTFSSSSNQAHKSTMAGGPSTSSSSSSGPDQGTLNSSVNDPATFRDRMQERGRLGSKAARRGARSFREMVQQYGPVFIGTYFTVYVSTVAGLFVGVESGLLDPAAILDFFMDNAADQQAEDSKSTVSMIVDLLDNYSWTRSYAPLVEKNPSFAHLAIAWFATKFTEPVRLAVTVSVTPRLARHFGYVVKEIEEDHHHVEEGEHIVVERDVGVDAASSEAKPPTETESSKLASETSTIKQPKQNKE